MVKKYKEINELTLIALLSAIIGISGMIKIPSFVGGAEFQLSAPLAVIIVACFGFKKYFIAGVIASFISFLLGTHTIINILVAMVFRLVAGGSISLFGPTNINLIISGPIGTIVARLVLSLILKVNPWTLIIGAIPGMIFTSLVVMFLYPLIYKALSLTEYRNILKIKGSYLNRGNKVWKKI